MTQIRRILRKALRANRRGYSYDTSVTSSSSSTNRIMRWVSGTPDSTNSPSTPTSTSISTGFQSGSYGGSPISYSPTFERSCVQAGYHEAGGTQRFELQDVTTVRGPIEMPTPFNFDVLTMSEFAYTSNTRTATLDQSSQISQVQSIDATEEHTEDATEYMSDVQRTFSADEILGTEQASSTANDLSFEEQASVTAYPMEHVIDPLSGAEQVSATIQEADVGIQTSSDETSELKLPASIENMVVRGPESPAANQSFHTERVIDEQLSHQNDYLDNNAISSFGKRRNDSCAGEDGRVDHALILLDTNDDHGTYSSGQSKASFSLQLETSQPKFLPTNASLVDVSVSDVADFGGNMGQESTAESLSMQSLMEPEGKFDCGSWRDSSQNFAESNDIQYPTKVEPTFLEEEINTTFPAYLLSQFPAPPSSINSLHEAIRSYLQATSSNFEDVMDDSRADQQSSPPKQLQIDEPMITCECHELPTRPSLALYLPEDFGTNDVSLKLSLVTLTQSFRNIDSDIERIFDEKRQLITAIPEDLLLLVQPALMLQPERQSAMAALDDLFRGIITSDGHQVFSLLYLAFTLIDLLTDTEQREACLEAFYLGCLSWIEVVANETFKNAINIYTHVVWLPAAMKNHCASGHRWSCTVSRYCPESSIGVAKKVREALERVDVTQIASMLVQSGPVVVCIRFFQGMQSKQSRKPVDDIYSA